MADEELLKLNDGRFFLDKEQSDIYQKIINARPHFSNQYSWSELSMADLFADCYRHNTRYCPDTKCWFVYNGIVWVRDQGDILVNDRLKEFVRLLSLYAHDLTTNEIKVDDYRAFVSKLSDRRARNRMIVDAQSESCIYINEFDRNPYLINCENGTYDLEKDEFHFHRAEDFLTLKTNCVYMTENLHYKCDRWFEFIDEITSGEKDKADYLQRALGYTLCGEPTEECMFFAHGKTTRNGKGTLFNTIDNVLGDYATTADSSLICSGGGNDVNQASPAVMALKGKRFVIMSETKKGATLNVRTIKSYTGNDMIPARELYCSVVNIKLQATLWLMCNDLPSVDDKTLFSSDRAKVIEFNRHFDENQRDTKLKQKFAQKESKAVIFKWLLDGYRDYLKMGLKEPQVVKDAIANYETQDDLVKLFIDECCLINVLGETLNTKLFESFEKWRKRADYDAINKRKFYENLDTKFESKKKGGYIYYKGVVIKDATIN